MFLITCPGFARQQTSAADLLADARTVYEQQGAKLALPKFEVVLRAYRDAHDRHGEAIVLGLMGNCYKHLGDYGHALQLLESALAMKRELHDETEEAKTLSNIGLLFWEQSQLSRATENFQAALNIASKLNDPRLEGTFRNNLGLILAEQGEYRKAMEEYQHALTLDRSAKFDRGESDVLGNIGGAYLELGHYQDALDQYRQSTEVAERSGLKPSVMQNLVNIGLIYTDLGKVDDALATFDQAVTMAGQQGMQREEADAHKDKGSALLQIGQYDAALQEYGQAGKIYDRSGQGRQKSELLTDEGRLYLSIGDLASAEKEFVAALRLAERVGYAQGVTSAGLELGEVERRRGENAAARRHFNVALEKARASGDDGSQVAILLELTEQDRAGAKLAMAEQDSARALEIAQHCGAPLLQARVLGEQGDTALARSQTESALARYAEASKLAESLSDSELKWQLAFGEGRALEAAHRFDDAVKAYARAVSEIESVRNQLREERFRAGYLQERYDVYVALVRLLVALHRVDEAFSYSERLRERSYQDLLGRKQQENGPPELAELRARIRHLQAAMVAEQEKSQNGTRASETIYSDELTEAESRYEALLDDLRSRSPDRFNDLLLHEKPPAQLKSALIANAAVLEYVVGRKSLVMFCLAAHGLHAKSIPVSRAALTAKVELLRDLLGEPGRDDWRLPAASLYRELILPAESAGWLQGVSRLYIVPHGILHYLPFAALVERSSQGDRFLVERYSLKNLPSASLLLSAAAPVGSGGTALAFAPARAHLRYATLEAQSVAGMFGKGSQALTGASATKASFVRLAGDYDVLHLATHGYFNRMNPMFSGIQLEPSGSDDGTLRVYEILDLRLHARLVTLSACETALGSGFFSDLPPGDEFVGLTRAFLGAGGNSVMATLWQINDSSTVRFMKDFYAQAGTENSEAALARAQRDMIAGSEYRHPYYWAPFVISGVGQ